MITILKYTKEDQQNKIINNIIKNKSKYNIIANSKSLSLDILRSKLSNTSNVWISNSSVSVISAILKQASIFKKRSIDFNVYNPNILKFKGVLDSADNPIKGTDFVLYNGINLVVLYDDHTSNIQISNINLITNVTTTPVTNVSEFSIIEESRSTNYPSFVIEKNDNEYEKYVPDLLEDDGYEKYVLQLNLTNLKSIKYPIQIARSKYIKISNNKILFIFKNKLVVHDNKKSNIEYIKLERNLTVDNWYKIKHIPSINSIIILDINPIVYNYETGESALVNMYSAEQNMRNKRNVKELYQLFEYHIHIDISPDKNLYCFDNTDDTWTIIEPVSWNPESWKFVKQYVRKSKIVAFLPNREILEISKENTLDIYSENGDKKMLQQLNTNTTVVKGFYSKELGKLIVVFSEVIKRGFTGYSNKYYNIYE